MIIIEIDKLFKHHLIRMPHLRVNKYFQRGTLTFDKRQDSLKKTTDVSKKSMIFILLKNCLDLTI
jgi:hypothetical protein